MGRRAQQRAAARRYAMQINLGTPWAGLRVSLVPFGRDWPRHRISADGPSMKLRRYRRSSSAIGAGIQGEGCLEGGDPALRACTLLYAAPQRLPALGSNHARHRLPGRCGRCENWRMRRRSTVPARLFASTSASSSGADLLVVTGCVKILPLRGVRYSQIVRARSVISAREGHGSDNADAGHEPRNKQRG